MKIEKYRRFGAGLLGFALAISISGVYVGLGLYVLFAAVLVALRQAKIVWKPSPLDVPIAVLFVWSVVSSGFSDQYPILFFYLFAHVFSEDDALNLFKWFLIGSALGGLLAVVQTFSGVIYNPTPATYTAPAVFENLPRGALKFLAVHTNRAVGTRSHALTYAECLMPAVYAFLALILVRPRWSTVVGLVLVLLGVLFAKGRAVWLGVVVGLFVFSCFLPPRKRLAAWLTLLFLVLSVGILSPTVRGRALSAFTDRSGSLSDQQSKQLRFHIWKEAFNIIHRSPITGVGADNVRINFKDVPGYEDRVWSETHNIYLQQAAEKGLVGLGLLFWVLIVVLRFFWKAPPPWRPALLGVLVSFLVAGLTESWANDSEVAMIFWTLIGMASAFVKESIHDIS